MFVRWNFTVCWVTQSSFAISSFERPRASAFRIAVSRSVSPAAFAPVGVGVAGEPGRAEDVALDRLPQGGGQVGRVDALRDVGARAAAQRGLDEVRRRRRRQHHDLRSPGSACGSRPGRRARPCAASARRAARDRACVLETSGSTWVPFCVSPTISKPPSASSARRMPSSMRRWSSAITTRMGGSVARRAGGGRLRACQTMLSSR